MEKFSNILQKLYVQIEDLTKNGENKNGKIDTTKEKDQLAKLLCGAEKEINDAFSYYKEGGKFESEEDKRELGVLFVDTKLSINKLKETLKRLICGYEKAETNQKGDIVSVSKRNDVKIRANGSYEEKLNEIANTFNVVIRDKKGNDIGRKSYTKSKKGIYTNKDKVAEYNNLLNRNQAIKKYDSSSIGNYLQCCIPVFGKFNRDRLAQMRQAFNQVKDDEAVDLETGTIYKWNSKTFEYKKVGKFEVCEDGSLKDRK